MSVISEDNAQHTEHHHGSERQRQILGISEWLIGGLALISLVMHIVYMFRAPSESSNLIVLGLGGLLASCAGALAFGGGRWDAWQARLLRRPTRPISVVDRWLTLLGAILLLGGSVAHLGMGVSMANKPSASSTHSEAP